MSDVSPSAQRITAVAVKHFADVGYDASSLAQIASGAGMRKPSLYAHFASKDALFLAVLATALEQETVFIEQCFAASARTEAPGQAYCARLAERYRSSIHLQFLLRTVYAPPEAVRSAVQDGYLTLLQRLETLFCDQLASTTYRGPAPAAADADLAQCYLGIIDSLHVELVYGQETAAERRRAALWAMFDRELTRNNA
jgi:AcrR family transcriptional regulator